MTGLRLEENLSLPSAACQLSQGCHTSLPVSARAGGGGGGANGTGRGTAVLSQREKVKLRGRGTPLAG